MDMEHGRDRHVDVARVEPALPVAGQRVAHRQRMQDELAMAEVHAFGQARGSGRVEGRGAGVLVEFGKLECGAGAVQQALVFGGELERGLRRRADVVEQDKPLAGIHAAPDLLQYRQELGIDQDDVVPRVIDGVEDLLRRQADVDRVQDGAHHRHREEALEVAMRVPVHDRDGVAGRDAQRRQAGGEAVHPRAHFAIAQAPLVGVDDLLFRRAAQAGVEQALDDQRARVRGSRRRNGCSGHLTIRC